MAKKEFKVGEVFQFGLLKLKCVKAQNYCDGCFLDRYCSSYEECLDLVGACSKDREDKTDVIFVKVEE